MQSTLLKTDLKDIIKSTYEIYPKVTSFDIKSIKDLTYIEDGKTLEDRIKAYWTEARIRLD